MDYIVEAGLFGGVIAIPPSKSDTQRALLVAALGSETSTLRNVGRSDDELAMLSAIEHLGAAVEWKNETDLVVSGNFQQTIFNELNCHESGLGFRLLSAIASLKSEKITLNGVGSLLQRKHQFIEQHFPQMGVKVEAVNAQLPFTIEGPLVAGHYVVDGSASSQFISGLLIAFSQVNGSSILKVEQLASRPYVDMTINTLKHFGIDINEQSKDVFEIHGKQDVASTDYTIDGDWSSASFWLVASALGLPISIKGLSMSSMQADKAILNALMHAKCTVKNGESGIEVDGSERIPLDFDATDCPDLFPALATYGALTNGVSKIKGVHRLANKESDRGQAIVSEFAKLGIKVRISDDTMEIYGGQEVEGATVFSHGDHRMAMCLGILSMVTKTPFIIQNADSVKKSYPNFWENVENLRKP